LLLASFYANQFHGLQAKQGAYNFPSIYLTGLSKLAYKLLMSIEDNQQRANNILRTTSLKHR